MCFYTASHTTLTLPATLLAALWLPIVWLAYQSITAAKNKKCAYHVAMEMAPQSRCTHKHCMTQCISVEPPSSLLGPPLSPSHHHPVCTYPTGERLDKKRSLLYEEELGFKDKKVKVSHLSPPYPHHPLTPPLFHSRHCWMLL